MGKTEPTPAAAAVAAAKKPPVVVVSRTAAMRAEDVLDRIRVLRSNIDAVVGMNPGDMPPRGMNVKGASKLAAMQAELVELGRQAGRDAANSAAMAVRCSRPTSCKGLPPPPWDSGL